MGLVALMDVGWCHGLAISLEGVVVQNDDRRSAHTFRLSQGGTFTTSLGREGGDAGFGEAQIDQHRCSYLALRRILSRVVCSLVERGSPNDERVLKQFRSAMIGRQRRCQPKFIDPPI